MHADHAPALDLARLDDVVAKTAREPLAFPTVVLAPGAALFGPPSSAWTVTSLVTTLYTTANNGFILRDRTEGAVAPGRWQYYDSDDAVNKPQLVLTWG